MLSGNKLKRCRVVRGVNIADLAQKLVPGNLAPDRARTEIKSYQASIGNWERGLMRPRPAREDIEALARALSVEPMDLQVWSACHKYAPIAPRKVKLVTEMIAGLNVQEALDVLKFANKRAAVMVEKVLSSAVANADEQEADLEKLYVSEARVDQGGIRRGTRRWRPKDRGRAVPFTRLASHIHICLDME